MPITHKQLSIALDDAHLTIARQAEVIAKMREVLVNLANAADEFETETATADRIRSDWQPVLLIAIDNARAAIALAESKP